MISVDSNNIIDEYNILNNELKQYNPELLDKEKMLAITKSDLIDDELKQELKQELPEESNMYSFHLSLNKVCYHLRMKYGN